VLADLYNINYTFTMNDVMVMKCAAVHTGLDSNTGHTVTSRMLMGVRAFSKSAVYVEKNVSLDQS